MINNCTEILAQQQQQTYSPQTKDIKKDEKKMKQLKQRLRKSVKNEINMIKYTKKQQKVFFEPSFGETENTIVRILSRNRVKLILSLLTARFFMYLPFSFINKEYPIIQGNLEDFLQVLPRYLLVSETIQCVFVSIFCGVFMDLYSMFSISQFSMAISILGISIEGVSIIIPELQVFMIGYSMSFFVKLAYLVCFEKIIFDTAVSFRQASINSSLLNVIACLARIISCLVSYYYNRLDTVQYIALAFSGLGILSHILPMRVLFNTIGLIEQEKLNEKSYLNFTKFKNYKMSPMEIKKIYGQKDYIYLVFVAVVLLFVTSFKCSTYIRHIIPNLSQDLCLMYTCFPSKNMSDVENITFTEYFLDAFHQFGGLIFCTPIVYLISSKVNSVYYRYKAILVASIILLFACIFQALAFSFKSDSSYNWNLTIISIVSVIFGAGYYLIRTLIIQLHFAINPYRSSVRGIGIAIIATFTELQSSVFSLYPYEEETIRGLFYFLIFLMVFIILFQYQYLKGKNFDKIEKVVTRKFKAIKM